ncbi:MAG: hypothetical protein ACFFC7_11280 [Candidatus Hermodarchaeota archaeon]
MSRKKQTKFVPLSNEDLSRFWYCPNDKSALEIHQSRTVQSAYFTISRKNIDVGIQNAVALKKIPPEAMDQTRELIEYLFKHDETSEKAELVGTLCPKCGTAFSAPRLARIEQVGNSIGKTLYKSQVEIKSKRFGPFRVVDHFGLGGIFRQEQRQYQSGYLGMWGIYWLLRFPAILIVVILLFVFGLQLKIGRRWLPLGLILTIFGILAFIIWIVYTGTLASLIDLIPRLIGGY